MNRFYWLSGHLVCAGCVSTHPHPERAEFAFVDSDRECEGPCSRTWWEGGWWPRWTRWPNEVDTVPAACPVHEPGDEDCTPTFGAPCSGAFVAAICEPV